MVNEKMIQIGMNEILYTFIYMNISTCVLICIINYHMYSYVYLGYIYMFIISAGLLYKKYKFIDTELKLDNNAEHILFFETDSTEEIDYIFNIGLYNIYIITENENTLMFSLYVYTNKLGELSHIMNHYIDYRNVNFRIRFNPIFSSGTNKLSIYSDNECVSHIRIVNKST